jgi:hypothetical protein
MDVAIMRGAWKREFSKAELFDCAQALKIARIDDRVFTRFDGNGSMNDVSDFHADVPKKREGSPLIYKTRAREPSQITSG